MLVRVQLNAQQDAFWLNYKRALRSDRISEAVTIPIIRGIFKIIQGLLPCWWRSTSTSVAFLLSRF
jgi:hypothetical protein